MPSQFILLILAVLAIVSTARSDKKSLQPPQQDYYRICPLPRCERCPTIEELQAPGIGFALEMGHGTAVVRHHNGTYQSIALIKGDSAYKEVMYRFVTDPKPRTPTEYTNTWSETWALFWWLLKRHINKLVGLPATPDTAILASMLSALREATEASVDGKYPINSGILSVPDHLKFAEAETNDIFDYLKLENLMMRSPSVFEKAHLPAASAAYRGYGKGLCKNYLDSYRCEEEEWYFPSKNILHVDLGIESFSGTIIDFKDGQSTITVEGSFVDLNLGYQEEKADEIYWKAIGERIREMVSSTKRRIDIDELVLSGPSANTSGLRVALREALHDMVEEEVLFSLNEVDDATLADGHWTNTYTFATARGAAEIAKRRQEGPVNCMQTDECKELRRQVHDGTLPKERMTRYGDRQGL
ncbi:hypothetical protein CB0940_08235 [Cercospora beticola]|uniref:Uncharacterized protein n=2 Tax=Cercospora beticola TaxID=122368 RepID=A0A2G5HP41_CERBT|nr:hypothetical protein CB0940_08235 [Cercospora beticola]PIA94311.1 hypothetical protein CB0940_08235 [Cercospora beticola]